MGPVPVGDSYHPLRPGLHFAHQGVASRGGTRGPHASGGGAANVRSALSPARIHHVPVWEITFGGLRLATPAPYLPPGPKVKTDGAMCGKHTAFVAARTGRELWEMLNGCTPVPVASTS